MREDEGTRRCPRSSKKRRNRSRTSVAFIAAPDNLRNLLRRKTAPRQCVEDAAPSQRRCEARPRGPQLRERAAQGLVFPRGAALRLERSRDDLLREPANL